MVLSERVRSNWLSDHFRAPDSLAQTHSFPPTTNGAGRDGTVGGGLAPAAAGTSGDRAAVGRTPCHVTPACCFIGRAGPTRAGLVRG